MKRSVLSLLVLSFALPASALSQEKERFRVRPNPAVASQPKQAKAAKDLDRNITLSLTGQLADASPIDLSLTGCGTEFQSDTVINTTVIGGNQVPNIGSIHFSVEEVEGGFRIDYSVGARLAVPTSTLSGGDGTKTNIGFQNVMITGTALCEFGKGLQIFRSGAHSLMLKVTEP